MNTATTADRIDGRLHRMPRTPTPKTPRRHTLGVVLALAALDAIVGGYALGRLAGGLL